VTACDSGRTPGCFHRHSSQAITAFLIVVRGLAARNLPVTNSLFAIIA
jgi:hypothetical protein